MTDPVKSNVLPFTKLQQRPITALVRFIPNGILNNSEHKLLLILATYANYEDKCWPLLTALAEDYYGNTASEIPEKLLVKREKNISEYMQVLKREKLVYIDKRNRNNIYTLNRALLNAYAEMRKR